MGQLTPAEVRVLTVTVSDSRKRHHDETGKRLDAGLAAAGFHVVRHNVIADDVNFIRELCRGAAVGNQADVVILTGGTGITPRDHTFEALDGHYEKKIDGFGEAFRRLVFDAFGPSGIYFRASAGVINECPIFSLPGNVQAVTIALEQLIVPTLLHAVEMATGRDTDTAGPSSVRPDLGSRPDVSVSEKKGA